MNLAEDSSVQGNSPPIGAGTVIAGRYRLEALVGEGAMGTVWRAEHLRLGSPVAVKLMGSQLAKVPNAAERFLREAKAAARLASEYVVRVFDFGVHGDTPFLVMELLQGESLRDRLDRLGRLPFEQVVTVVTHCCLAVQRAHAAGIIHRDLKPENLFLVEEGQLVVKVLDFGIAKVSAAWAGPQQSHTQTGAVIGTPYYMSPEQVRGRAVLDHRADLWSIAVIAHEALCGELPFQGETFGDLVLKICTEKPTASGLGPPGFAAWLTRGLAKRPADRFGSAEEMRSELTALGSGSRPKEALPQTRPPVVSARSGASPLRPALIAPSPASFAAVAVRGGTKASASKGLLWLGAAVALGAVATLVFQIRRAGDTGPSTPAAHAVTGTLEDVPVTPVEKSVAPHVASKGPAVADAQSDTNKDATPEVKASRRVAPGAVSDKLNGPLPSAQAGGRVSKKGRQGRKRSRNRAVRRKKSGRPAVATTDLFSVPD